ncbi:MAG TPA: hypothetical protein VGN57_06545 [Pirellulaceae bacterium]|jgi:hypothetical protein|nr:hypothetical protein [Pirellulaceae bacterium]
MTLQRADGKKTGSVNDRPQAAFDVEYFVSIAASAGVTPAIDARTAVARYLDEPELRRLSPNRLFDELWYRTHYPRVGESVLEGRLISGFWHYCTRGFEMGFLPNGVFHAQSKQVRPENPAKADDFDRLTYLRVYPEAESLLDAFPFFDAVGAFNAIGRLIGHRMEEAERIDALIARSFDADFYRTTYGMEGLSDAEALAHYLEIGVEERRSPSKDFDEEWYLSFYKDLREAKEEGRIKSGFAHYLVVGEREQRLPKHQMQGALEAAAPGVTEPTLIKNVRALDVRLRAIPAEVDPDAPRTFWIICPRLNPDLVFGGYKALFELLRRLKPYLRERGMRMGFILTEEQANREYVLYRYRNRPADLDLFSDVPIASIFEVESIEMGPQDRFLTYSCWDAWYGKAYAAETDEPRFISLIQEYEPIFHAYGSFHATMDAAFRLPQYPIFNSVALRDYFVRHRLGIFGNGTKPRENVEYGVFEHVPTNLPLQSVESMSSRDDKWALIYARPESHAMRNLFEIEVLALQKACEAGVFDETWNFMGLGALSDHRPLDLGGGHTLELKAKLPEDEYRAFIQKLDIGVSLMYAPHPSVVPFEFAATGAAVVTNRFDGRDDDFFASICRNIVPCEPSIDGVADALAEAVSRQPRFQERHDQALRLGSTSWGDVFDAAFIERHFAWAVEGKPSAATVN